MSKTRQLSDPTKDPHVPVAPDLPDLGYANTRQEFFDWCNKHRRQVLGVRQNLSTYGNESASFQSVKNCLEIARQSDRYLTAFGNTDLMNQTWAGTVVGTQESRLLAWFGSLVGDNLDAMAGNPLFCWLENVERLLSEAMEWCTPQNEIKPRWDGMKLWFGDIELRSYQKKAAPEQAAILEALEKAGWPSTPVPLSNCENLHVTIKRINEKIKGGIIQLQSAGNSKSVVWSKM